MIYKNKKIPNTFGFDVKAASYADYDSVEELENLIACGCIVSPFLHIGCGSNLLFEKDYEGTVLHSRIGGVEVTAEDDERGHVSVGGGGCDMGRLCGLLCRAGMVRSRESVADTR